MSENSDIKLMLKSLNTLPVVAAGLNARELGLWGTVVTLVCFACLLVPIGGMSVLYFGRFAPAIGITFFVTFVVMIILFKASGFFLPAIRRGKPEGYHVILLRGLFEDYISDLIGHKKTLIRKSGPWSISRTNDEKSR